jgi:hypothetical protein
MSKSARETMFAELKKVLEEGKIYMGSGISLTIEQVDHDLKAEKFLASCVPDEIQYLRIIDLAKSVHSNGILPYHLFLDNLARAISCGAKSVDYVESWLFERLRHPDG